VTCLEALAQDPDAYLIDVRSRAEFLPSHAGPAIHVPLGSLSRDALAAQGLRPGARARVFCICASGIRSVQAAARLRRLGFTNVAVVDGGLQGWSARGLPVASMPSPPAVTRLLLGAMLALLTIVALAYGGRYGLLASSTLGLATAAVTPWAWLSSVVVALVHRGLRGRVWRRPRRLAHS
jgi:rhodanese-related sulfurtransferase